MSDNKIIVICPTASHAACLRTIYPRNWVITYVGANMAGYRADAILVVGGVDVSSDWFQHVARLRLCSSNSPVLQIADLRIELDQHART